LPDQHSQSCPTTAWGYQINLQIDLVILRAVRGHDCEVLNPGNYLTVQIGEYPVVVLRDRDGGLRAFHNTCRHRGSRIFRPSMGPPRVWYVPIISGPTRSTALIAARDMGDEFDKSQHGLKPVHCASVAATSGFA